MQRRSILIIPLLLLLFLLLALPIRAQDVTPEATPVVTFTPAPVVTPAPYDFSVVLPYLGAALVVAVLGIITVAGTGLLLLFRSTPAAQFLSKTVLPPLGDAGVAAYETYAKLTPEPFDDDLAKQLRAEWEAYKKQLTEDVQTLVSRAMKPNITLDAAIADQLPGIAAAPAAQHYFNLPDRPTGQ